jgi:predicted metal-dependent hydrolase
MADPPFPAYERALASGQFFEAHEIMEEFWIGYRGADRDFYKGLIQAAAALHHAARGNPAGASRVARRARAYLAPYAPRHGAIDVDALLRRLTESAA